VRSCKRPKIPRFLRENAPRWNAESVKRSKRGRGSNWSIQSFNSKRVYQLILPHLIEMTLKHCAYCDGFPLGATSRKTIDHFRPRSSRPEETFAWRNLFPCCDVCQTRGKRFSNALLKPDAARFTFRRYFQYDPQTGELSENPLSSARDRERARITIEHFKLNEIERCESRVFWFDWFKQNTTVELNSVPYRFLFE
jgi:uncharacterized protein (TIGR02646 family)